MLPSECLRNEWPNEDECILLSVCVKGNCLHWHKVAFISLWNRFIDCTRLLVLHSGTAGNLHNRLALRGTVRGAVGVTVQLTHLRVPDISCREHQVRLYSLRMFWGNSRIGMREYLEAVKILNSVKLEEIHSITALQLRAMHRHGSTGRAFSWLVGSPLTAFTQASLCRHVLRNARISWTF